MSEYTEYTWPVLQFFFKLLIAWTAILSFHYFSTYIASMQRTVVEIERPTEQKCFVLDRYASFFRDDDPKAMDIGTSIRNQIVQNYSKAQVADETTYMSKDRGPVRVDVMPATLYMKKSSKLYAEKSPWYIRYSPPITSELVLRGKKDI